MKNSKLIPATIVLNLSNSVYHKAQEITLIRNFPATPEGALEALRWARDFDARKADAYECAELTEWEREHTMDFDFEVDTVEINGYPLKIAELHRNPPETYVLRPDAFALFSRITVPCMPSKATIEKKHLVAGYDYPADGTKTQATYKAMKDFGLHTAIIFLSSDDLLAAMEKYPELFRISDSGVWQWTGEKSLWYVEQCLREFPSYHMSAQTYAYEELPKNSGTSGSSRSDATEKEALKAFSVYAHMILEWVGQQKRGKKGAYYPDAIHKDENGKIDFILEVKGFGGKFACSDKAKETKLTRLIDAIIGEDVDK